MAIDLGLRSQLQELTLSGHDFAARNAAPICPVRHWSQPWPTQPLGHEQVRAHLQEYACVDYTVMDMDLAESRFRTKPWISHSSFPEAWEMDGELWRWVNTGILPRHPLASAYHKWNYDQRWDAPNFTIMPTQLWSVEYFEEVKGEGSAWSAIHFLECHGFPFHSRLLAVSLGHSADVRASGLGHAHEDYWWYGPVRGRDRPRGAFAGAPRSHRTNDSTEYQSDDNIGGSDSSSCRNPSSSTHSSIH